MTDRKPNEPRFRENWYASIAIAVLDALILIVLVEVAASLTLKAVRHFKADDLKTYQTRFENTPESVDKFRKLYGGRSLEEIVALEKEAASQQIYEPWVEFKEKPRSGTYINVEGIVRKSVPELTDPSREPNERIFFFGGSTMFGFRLADDETIPSLVAKRLSEARGRKNVQVVNYGQPHYNSRQEMFRFFELLSRDDVPSIAVFLDGAADVIAPGASVAGRTFWSKRFEQLFEIDNSASFSFFLRAFASNSSLYQLIEELGGFDDQRTHAFTDTRDSVSGYALPKGETVDSAATKIVNSYQTTLEATAGLCREFKVKCLFVWQPVQFYAYDKSREFMVDKKERPLFAKTYPLVEKLGPKINSDSTEFLWLGNMIENGRPFPIFIDTVHYTAPMNAEIADHIIEALRGRKWLEPAAK